MWLPWLLLQLVWFSGGRAVDVSTAADFLDALLDSNATLISLDSDISIAEVDWLATGRSFPASINRNISFTCKQTYCVLDFNYADPYLFITPKSVLSFTQIVFNQTRYGSGVNFDFVGYSPGALLYLNNSIIWRMVCIAPNVSLLESLPRPTSIAGQQSLYILPSFCVLGSCWPDVLVYQDFVVAAPEDIADNPSEGGYTVEYWNSHKLCQHFVSPECVADLGSDACLRSQIDYYMAPPSPVQEDNTLPWALGLGLGLGVVALSAVTLFAIYWKRKHRKPEKELSAVVVARSVNDSPTKYSLSDVVRNDLDGWQFMQALGTLKGPSAPAMPSVELGPMLGSGCFGKVYKGTYAGMPVAVKVLIHDSSSMHLVANEVKLMLSFRHVHVVQALHYMSWCRPHESSNSEPRLQISDSASTAMAGDTEVGMPFVCAPADEVQTWIVEEYCDQGPLSQHLRGGRFRSGNLPDLSMVLSCLRDVASGIAHLHACNVVHGDLKAANILLHGKVGGGTVAKVCDFGLSRALTEGQTHLSTRTVGTVTHMAPELLKWGHMMPAGDVYSFGMIMWEMITGQHPFSGLMYGEVIERVVVGGSRPEFPQYTPPCYAALARRCWDQDVAGRPRMAEACKELEQMCKQAEDLQRDMAAAALQPPVKPLTAT